jgi:hypothetical protein
LSRSRYLDDLGLRSSWNSEDRAACQSAAADALRNLKKGYGGANTPVEQIPGLLESVRYLLGDGYGLTDVATMFGVSRERIRQWATKFDIQRHTKSGSSFRLWDDAARRFVPVSTQRMVAVARRHHERQLDLAASQHQESVRQEHLTAFKRLARQFGRTPTLGELEVELGTAWPQIARSWGYDSNSSESDATYAAAYRNLCEAAHVPPRSVGGAGHVT